MKKILMVAIILIASVTSYGQENSRKEIIETMFVNGTYKPYEIVVDAQGKNKSEIYTAVKLWYGKTFKNAKEVIQADVPGEVLVGVGNVTVYNTTYWFEISTLFKDNKFKTTVTPRKTYVAKYPGILNPSLDDFYSDWKNGKAGFFCRTGAMSYKEFILVDLVYSTDKSIVDGIIKEVQNYGSF